MTSRTMCASMLAIASTLVLLTGSGHLAADQTERPHDESAGNLAATIRRLVDESAPGRRLEQQELHQLYSPREYAPLWMDIEHVPTADARTALDLFRQADRDGLDSGDYRSDAFDVVDQPGALQPMPYIPAARFDLEISRSLLRLYRHLHLGRVDPRATGFDLDVPAHEHDFVEIVRSARTAHRISETAATLRPPLPQYGHLQRVLLEYRSLTSGDSLTPVFPAAVVIHPGDSYPDVNAIRPLLVALGDLDAAAATPDGRYEGAFVEAVERFQRRHGLDVDGVLGQNTQAAMTVPLSWRVRQVELGLERLRWLPDLGPRPLVAVNIPMFRLWAWETLDQPPAISMNVVVGRAVGTKTPVFVAEMAQVVFRPYWNVPTSIARNELLPDFERDPARIERDRFEVIAMGDAGGPVATTPAALAEVRRGGMRLRQQPGGLNPLGLVKFIFPNVHDVYMHATPANAAFGRSRRDFSHGCIRLEDPVALARWALGNTARWSAEEIEAAMQGADNQQVPLPEAIQVVLFYLTAAVVPDDGTLHFAEDIYGHDRRLDHALTTRPRQ